jgi:hypothetical protein
MLLLIILGYITIGYLWLLLAILFVPIGDYFINGYWWTYFINGY